MTSQKVDGANRAHPKVVLPTAIAAISVLVPLAAASLAAHSLFAGESLAYYRHDWGWPADQNQLALSFWRDIGAWDSSGLGLPNHQPMLHPVLLLWHVMAPVFPAWLVGALTIFLSLAAYGFGVAACARRIFGLTELPSALIGAAAVLSAPMYDKIVAGHIYYLIALASYPWVVRFSLARDRAAGTSAFAAAAAAALCAIQIQIFVVALGTIVVGAIRSRAHAAWALVAVALSFVLFIPEAFAYANADVLHSVGSLQTTLAWQYNNSSSLLDALLALGYAPHYYEHALAATGAATAVTALLWILFAAALAGVISARRDPVSWLLLALVVLTAFLVAGLYGPLAGPLSYLYGHTLWASAFRELYHFAAIEWTFVCVLAAAALARLSLRPAVAIAACAVAVLSIPWCAPYFAGQLVPSPPSTYTLNSVAQLRSGRFDGRFLLVPAEWPLRPQNLQTSGEDPIAYAIAGHPTANMYRPEGVVEAAVNLTESGAPTAKRWRAVAGIGAVLSRRGVHPDLSARYPPLAHIPVYVRALMQRRIKTFSNSTFTQSTCLFCAYRSIPTVRESTDAAEGDAFVLVRDLALKDDADPDLAARSEYQIPAPSLQTVDPSRGWVSADAWSWLDVRLALNSEGVLTWSSGSLACPVRSGDVTFAHVVLLHGRLHTDKGAVRAPLGRPSWIALPAGARSIRVVNGLVAINRFVTLPRYVPLHLERTSFASGPALSFDWVAESGSGTISKPVHYVVLKQSYSSGWRLVVPGGRVLSHFVASGYANGWQVRVDRPTHISVYYERTHQNDFLLVVSLLLWIAVTVAAVVKR